MVRCAILDEVPVSRAPSYVEGRLGHAWTNAARLAGREKEKIPIRIRSAINDCSARFRSISNLCISLTADGVSFTSSLCGLLRGPPTLGTVPVLLLVFDECSYTAVDTGAGCESRDEVQEIRDYGFRLSQGKLGWGLVVGVCALMIPILILALQLFPAFQYRYPLCKIAGSRWQLFIPYELAYGVYMFSWEFFFRGFMLFGLERKFGRYSILIQTLPFAVMHYNKPFPEAIGSIFAGVLLGVIALETRSFIYGAAIHWFVAMTMDVLALAWR